MKRPTVADLMAEIQALKKRIADLEARPPLVIHNHPPAHLQPLTAPRTDWPLPYPGWRPGDVWCTVTAVNGGGSGC